MVTATRTPTPVRELLNDISVITQEDIQRAGQASLPELLRTVPGVEFTSNGGAGTNSSVFIRGANANHTLVLIDGMRINSATTGTTALEKIPLAQIDHIEILRGPGSSLYGSEAIGGVIQIFTKSGTATPSFHLGGGIGSRGLYQVNTGGNGKLGETNFNLEVAHESTDSFSAIGDSASTSYNADTDPYRNTSASLKLSHRLNDRHEFGATGFYSNGKGHFDASRITGSTLSYQGRVEAFNVRASITWQRPIDESNGTLLQRRANTNGIDRIRPPIRRMVCRHGCTGLGLPL